MSSPENGSPLTFEPRRFWTPDDITQLRELMNNGANIVAVAHELNRSPKACRMKWYELGMAHPRTHGYRIWTPAEDDKLVALYHQGLGNIEIAERLQATHATIAGRINNLRHRLPKRTYEQHAAIRGWTDRSRDEEFFEEPVLAAERKAIFEEFRNRKLLVLVLSDIHGSFRHHEVLNAAGKLDVDVLVLAGDVMDQYAISRFRKGLRIDLKRELFDTMELLQWCSARFPRTLITQGNHDQRAYRQLLSYLEKIPDLAALLKNETDLLHKAAEGLPNVTSMKGWWVKLGKAIFTHRERYAKHERTLGEDVVRYFENLDEDFELLVTGHVHRATWLPIKRNKLYIENPACCYRPDYTRESGAMSATIGMGYSLVSIRQDGSVDFNASRPHLVAWE